MNECEKKPEGQAVVIRINLARVPIILLTLTLAVVAIMFILNWGQQEAAASPIQAPAAQTVERIGLRQYYRTSDSYTPTVIISACAAGYHFASLWEILDTSNLEYNSILGDYQADSGSGPLSQRRGWVRTGYDSDESSGIPGQSNCLAWTSNSVTGYGTSAELMDDWQNETPDVGVWIVGNDPCYARVPVWCVED